MIKINHGGKVYKLIEDDPDGGCGECVFECSDKNNLCCRIGNKCLESENWICAYWIELVEFEKEQK